MRLIDADRLKRQVEGRSWRAKEKFIELIDTAPTIEAEPVKHGRWEWHNEDGWYYSCSVCGHNAYGNTDNIVSGLWAYCPRCGAKLDLPGEKL